MSNDFFFKPFQPAPHTIHLPHAPDAHGSETRWRKIESTMSRKISNVEGLLQAMTSPGPDTRGIPIAKMQRVLQETGDMNHQTLYFYLTKRLSAEERTDFFDKTLPFIQELVLELSNLFPDKTIPKLRQGHAGELNLSRRQVACILACAFFSLFKRFPDEGYPLFNFEGIFSIMERPGLGKIACVIRYFEALRSRGIPEGNFTIRRIVLSDEQRARFTSENVIAMREFPLRKFDIVPNGAIEEAVGCIQADFANKYIGGGALGGGSVQEEIRFVINPECLISCLVCEVMSENEAIVIIGAEQFSKYSGYGGTFAYDGPFEDETETDDQGRVSTVILAIDALYARKANQFTERNLMRELVKSVVGNVAFHTDLGGKEFTTFATGNWGCGVFGGDLQLKSMIQWISASIMGVDLLYYPFFDKRAALLGPVTKLLREKDVPAGVLYRDILHWCMSRKTDLFPYLAAKYLLTDDERKSDEAAAGASSLTAEELTALRALAKSFHRLDLLQEHVAADEAADEAAAQEGRSGNNSLYELIEELKTKSNTKERRPPAAAADASSAPAQVDDEAVSRLSDSVESLTI